MFNQDLNTRISLPQVGYEGSKMWIERGHQQPSPSRRTERGNIVLVAAMIVLALGGGALALGGLVRSRIDYAADLRGSNYAGSLAQNAAESAVNNLLFNWNAGVGVTPGAGVGFAGQNHPSWGQLLLLPSTQTNYAGMAASVTSTASYKITVTGAASPYAVHVDATASTDTTSGTAIFPSPSWRTVTRQIDATISLEPTNQYEIVGYRR